MPYGFSQNSLTRLDISLNPAGPGVIDDYTLATLLKFRTKTLWYLILNRQDLYRVRTIPKAHHKVRVIHAPQKTLKYALKNLNRNLLNPLQEPLGDHVAAYRKYRSIKTAVEQHVRPCSLCDTAGNAKTPKRHACPKYGTLIKIDLKDFFHSTKKTWVRKCFKKLGYSHYVSDLIANLTTVSIAKKGERAKDIVPQGSPASGAICNLVANQRMDHKIQHFLEDLNRTGGLQPPWDWRYTRYSDDLILSCGKMISPEERKEIVRNLKQLIHTCGYRVNSKKIRTPHSYYRKRVLGIVINRKMNIPKEEYRNLRALVHNCQTAGFNSQYKRAGKKGPEALRDYIRGRIGFVTFVNPEKGTRLMTSFKQAEEKWLTQS